MRCPTCGCEYHPREAPTPKQRRVLDFITDYHAKVGSFPTYFDICYAMGYRTLSTAHEHVEHLATKGWVTVRKNHGIVGVRAA